MASSTEALKLPDSILSGNPLPGHTFDELGALVREKIGSGMTLSSLCKRILKYRLEQKKLLEENRRRHITSSSLACISGAKILDELSKSADIEADLKAVADTLTETTLQQLLRDPRAPYHVLRAFHALPQSYLTKEATGTGRRAVDIDEAVLENDRYIRFRGGLTNTDGKYIVGLKAFAGINSPAIAGPNKTLTITRECPPKGGLELLDIYRRRTLRIQQNDAAYTKNFEKITQGALSGLRWDNLVVAGSTALQALLDMDHTAHVNDCDVNDISIFLYGLDATRASLKLREIESLWKSNLDPSAEVCVLRTESFVEFRVNPPYKSAHVALRIFQSPTEILSHFHLDAYAIGYDGRQVLMIPRCARAIETGYSIFTTDLITPRHLNHHLDISSSRTMKDLFKLAHLGFGIRILPCHVKSLEKSALEVANSALVETGVAGNSPPASFRKPAEAREHGLKTLRRILLRAHVSMTTDDQHSLQDPNVNFDPHGFDSFVRNCEFWRLYSIPLDAVDSYPTVYETTRSSRSNSEKLFNSLRHVIAREVGQQNMGAIPAYRNYLTRRIRDKICEENLTLALKRQISVPFIIPLDLEIYILHDIPQQHNDLPHLCMRHPPIIPVHDTTKYTQYTDMLLEENQYDPIPSIPEKADEGGNLRYRIITERNMWAGQHPVLDEIAILLRILCQWFDHATSTRFSVLLPEDFHTDSERAILHLAWSYKSFQLRATGKANGELPYSSGRMRTGRSALTREYEIFRQWVKQPDEKDGNHDGISSQRHPDSCPRTEEDENEWSREGPLTSPWWWTEGDEGEWDEGGVPPWTEWE